MQQSSRVGVVGGGLAALSSACVLAARGYSVVLFERNAWVGGKAAVLERDGYRFDMGPTILTMPSVLKRIYDEAGRDLHKALELIPLDPQWRCFFDGGSRLDLLGNVDHMASFLERSTPGSGEGYRKFMALARKMHDISDRYFFYRPLGGLKDTFNLGNTFTLSVLQDLIDMRLGGTVGGTIRSYIKDKNAAQMLDHFTQYIGSSPEGSPAILCGIASMQTEEGVWYPRGGTGAVPRALAKLARELGVEIRTNTGIRRILQDGARVTGVETESGEQILLGAVVSNADSVRTHRELLGGKAARKFEKRRGYEPACSGVVLYLGLNRRYDHLMHHDFVFSRDPHEEFDYIYRKGEPAPDPTCYLAAPSCSEPEVAPRGAEALYILVHTPYLRPHHDWKKMLPQYRQTILNKLKKTAGLTDIEDRIVTEDFLTPQDIHDRYGVLNGAIYGLASHGRLTGAFKPSNVSPDLEGLYLAGGAAHPGPGMPMVLMSGWIAADALDRDGVVKRIPQTANSTAWTLAG